MIEVQWVLAMSVELAVSVGTWWPAIYLIPLAILARFSDRTWFVLAGPLAAALLPLLDPPSAAIAVDMWQTWHPTLQRLLVFVAWVIPWRLLRRSAIGLHHARSRDPLTGLLNTRAFHELLERELQRSARSGDPVTVMFIDCDRFKLLNDQRGHRVGDQTLCAIARTLHETLRPYDAAARCGGDEFLVFVTHGDPAVAPSIVQRIHGALTQAMQAARWDVTFSLGAVTTHGNWSSSDALIAMADQLMYRIKRQSGNAACWRSVDDADGAFVPAAHSEHEISEPEGAASGLAEHSPH